METDVNSSSVIAAVGSWAAALSPFEDARNVYLSIPQQFFFSPSI